jgi:membrane protein YqaA with SNARE-associated domain
VADIVEPARDEAESPFQQSFGVRHLLAIAFAVGITVGIFLFRDQVQRFRDLAYLGVFLIMLLTSATVILPAPGIVFVFALGAQLNPLLVGLAGGPGAALGEMTGYMAGYGASAIADNLPIYERIARWVGGRFGLAFIALLAFIPNPVFDMAGMVAGTLRIKWWQFLLAVMVGKTSRSILIAYGGAYSMEWVERIFM